jgi:hypothetical protein
MEDIIDELAAAGTIEVEPPVSVQDAISKTEMRCVFKYYSVRCYQPLW